MILRRMMASIPSGSCASIAGNATTAMELRSCTIGGCCGKNTPMLTPEQVHERMPALPRWQLSACGKEITTKFVAQNWAAAMKFFNEVSVIAEGEGHHPNLHLENWREVRVELSTHAIGGLSLPDMVMAAKIDALDVEYSAKWLKSESAGSYAAAVRIWSDLPTARSERSGQAGTERAAAPAGDAAATAGSRRPAAFGDHRGAAGALRRVSREVAGRGVRGSADLVPN